MLSLLNFKSISVIVLLVLVLSVALYISILRERNQSLTNTVQRLETENTELTIKLTNSEKYIESLKNDYKIISGYNEELQRTSNELRLKQQDLQSKLQKLNTNFSKMVDRHPKMVIDIINNSQKKVNVCFENLSKHQSCD